MIINQSFGKSLPDLTNPATENEVLSGYEFIDNNGDKKTGIAPKIISSTTDIEEGTTSSYPEGTLYVVYEEG